SSGFEEDAIKLAFGLKEFYDYPLGGKRPEVPDLPADPFDLCLRLFLEGRIVPRADIRAVAGDETLSALEALGLLEADVADASRCWCSVSLYPVRELFIVSDRWSNPDGSSRPAADDMVYAAMVRNTNSFLNVLLDTPCEHFLDLCSGTGAAALYAARDFAGHAYAYDITERSTVFAGFNARLNELPNVTVAQGDVYAPAGDQVFDRIVAHPPYVPVLRHKWIYHSGGPDGEQITRKVVEGLPKHLAPGGTFICLAAGTDRSTGPLEARLREWLGDAKDEFDITVVVRNQMEPPVFAIRQVLFGFANLEDLREWKKVFHELQVNFVIYGPIIIQRRATPRPVFTVRRKAGTRSTPHEVYWTQRWETMVAEGNLSARLLPSTLKAMPGIQLRIEHELDGEQDWDARRYLMTSNYPFAMECDNSAFLALLTSRLQQPVTGAEAFEQLKREGIIHSATDPEEFCEALATLISGGFVDTSACPLPLSETTELLGGLEGAE
ncbi:MAG: methyltransferase, partial [Acidobacteria bacterium]|nr:methyltransferase [Acidobacteriota bacterium]